MVSKPNVDAADWPRRGLLSSHDSGDGSFLWSLWPGEGTLDLWRKIVLASVSDDLLVCFCRLDMKWGRGRSDVSLVLKTKTLGSVS